MKGPALPGNGHASGDCDLLFYLACLNDKEAEDGNANAVEELKVAEINLKIVARVPALHSGARLESSRTPVWSEA